MNYLSVEKLSKTYNLIPLFKNLTFGIEQGQKVALVGKNGSGKSTLLNIIAGLEAPDTGSVVFRKGLKVKFLPQNPNFDKHLTVREYIFDQDNEMLKTISEYEQYTEGEMPESFEEHYQQLVNRLDALQAWDYESTAKQVLGKLGIHNLERKIDELSGGEKKRVALASTLIEQPDFLILDEPTNHLDIDVIEWLENYLSTQNMSLLLVTHDRYFLEKVTSEIFELENETIYTYKGNYSYFISKKAALKQQQTADVARARNLLVKELDWLGRMPKARGTKAKYRIDAIDDLQEKATHKLDEDQLTIKVISKRQGKKILELHDVTKTFDGNLLIKPFSYTFKKKDRIGVVGKNGTGKTTLMNLITGELKPDDGKIEKGETIAFGYYKQEEVFFKHGQKVIDIVKDVTELIRLSDGSTLSASRFLEQFLFPTSMHYVYVEKLSGGEKKRLQLLRVLLSQPNFLILDEPTNDLDIYVMNVLEQYLMQFPGTLVIVSHDRYFMDKLTEHLFVFEVNGDISDFPGNYTDYKTQLSKKEKTQREGKKNIPKQVKEKKQPNIKRKLSFKEQRELEQLEIEIEQLETEKESVLQSLNEGSDNHEQITDWSMKFDSLNNQIDDKTARWMELSEI